MVGRNAQLGVGPLRRVRVFELALQHKQNIHQRLYDDVLNTKHAPWSTDGRVSYRNVLVLVPQVPQDPPPHAGGDNFRGNGDRLGRRWRRRSVRPAARNEYTNMEFRTDCKNNKYYNMFDKWS